MPLWKSGDDIDNDQRASQCIFNKGALPILITEHEAAENTHSLEVCDRVVCRAGRYSIQCKLCAADETEMRWWKGLHYYIAILCLFL